MDDKAHKRLDDETTLNNLLEIHSKNDTVGNIQVRPKFYPKMILTHQKVILARNQFLAEN